MTIVIADEELWTLRPCLQEVSCCNARLIPAWPVTSAQGLIRRLQPEWVLLPTDSGAAIGTCSQLRHWVPRVRLLGVGVPPHANSVLALSRHGVEALLPRPVVAAALTSQLRRLFATNCGEPALPALVGDDPALEQVRLRIAKVAACDIAVLLRGESGTGKEIAAHLIHRLSARHAAPFIKLNCAAIPAELLESELFGYEPGAFTGAARKKAGKFELARGGTIFLDEIGELHPSLQAKLLHILQGGEFSRLGSEATVTVEARVVAASNADLEAAVAAGHFRADLFYRLNVVAIYMPPLRQRLADIPLLIRHFRNLHAGDSGPEIVLCPGAMDRLLAHSWPGNVRELENFVRRYLILDNELQALAELTRSPSSLVAASAASEERPRTFSFTTAASPTSLSLLEIGRRAALQAERTAIVAALEQTRWNRRQAARLLQVSYKALHNKLRAMKQEANPTAVHPWPSAKSRAAAV